MDMTLLLDQGGTVSSHSVTGAWIVVMPVMVERYAEIAKVAIQFCPETRFLPVTHSPSAAAFRGAAGERKFRPAARQNQQRNACRFPDGTRWSPRLRTGRRAAAGAGLRDEYRREISALRNL